MRTRNQKPSLRVLALAVPAAMAAAYGMPSYAQETPAWSRAPANFAEIDVVDLSRSSVKFGEYTGVRSSGATLNGSFGMRGGDAYQEGDGIRRWEIYGTDLGLTSRSAGGTISDQGRWNFGVNLDQLRHYTSGTYQTPYTGNVGGNVFTLPNFGTVAGGNAKINLTPAQLSQFQTETISNDRNNFGMTGGLVFDRQWNIRVDVNRLEQSGAKLMGFGSAAAVAGTGNNEKTSILPMPTNFTTDTANVALNWLGEKGHATVSYYGSFFHNKYDSGVTFQTWTPIVGTTKSVFETMSTLPSNQLHQFSATGGYSLTQTTKVSGGFSYSRNTQNAPFVVDSQMMNTPAPAASLNGLVITTHADLKLTDQTTKNLTTSLGWKYDDRNNRTASNIYNFFALDGTAVPAGGHVANYPNAPFSIRKNQVELAGDYRLDARQKVRVAFNHDEISRRCNDYATGGGIPAYAPGTDCVTSPNTKEDKVSALYRVKAMEALTLNAGYSFSNRRSDRDLNARPPFVGTDGNTTAATIAAAPPGITGLNGSEFIGFNQWFLASRKQNAVKVGANWDATERLSFGATGRATIDNYDTTYGIQRGRSWSANLDSTYVYRENGSFSAFVTEQQRIRQQTDVARSPVSAPTATVP
ncbi:MAG: MtrB/PioB family decaheme-associated outer membrane protein, partial [Betaproteobacteria bacterium]|nr:MtrB/PioB family decaheme-associated outer membrane protein [Betaproteobacteria bacterium]